MSNCHVCAAIEEAPNKPNTELAAKVGTSEASIRRHRKANHNETERLYAASIRDPDTGSWHKYRYESPDPQWPVIQPATPVQVTVSLPSAKPAREGLNMSLKCADTQIGYRALSDGTYEAFHDEKAMALFAEVVRREQPDSVVVLGDLIDLPSQGKYAQEAGFARTTQKALDATYVWLATLRASAPGAKIVVVEGNHDKRMQNFVEANALAAFGLRKAALPDSWPVMSLPNLLRLDELDIQYVDAYPAATYWDNDTTRNIHGTKANSRGSTTSQYSNELPHLNTWVGHVHRAEITHKTVLGPGGRAIETYVANPGCLCRTDGAVPGVNSAIGADGHSAEIVENWQQGFGVLYYDDNNSYPEVYRIRDGSVIYRGEVLRSS